MITSRMLFRLRRLAFFYFMHFAPSDNYSELNAQFSLPKHREESRENLVFIQQAKLYDWYLQQCAAEYDL